MRGYIFTGDGTVHGDDRQAGRQQRGHGRRSGIRIHRIDNHGLGSLRLGILRLILLSGGVVLSIGHHQIDTKIFGSGLSAITQIDKERVVERGDQKRDLIAAAGGRRAASGCTCH